VGFSARIFANLRPLLLITYYHMLALLCKLWCTEDSTYPAHAFSMFYVHGMRMCIANILHIPYLCARYAHVQLMIFRLCNHSSYVQPMKKDK
jgi:hypothetical protein